MLTEELHTLTPDMIYIQLRGALPKAIILNDCNFDDNLIFFIIVKHLRSHNYKDVMKLDMTNPADGV